MRNWACDDPRCGEKSACFLLEIRRKEERLVRGRFCLLRLLRFLFVGVVMRLICDGDWAVLLVLGVDRCVVVRIDTFP